MTNKVVETAAQSNPPEHREIDGPQAKGLRRILRIFPLILQPVGYMDDNVRRYDPMFKIGGDSGSPLVYVGDPDVVREIFMLDDTKVVTGQNNRVLQTMVGEHSILLLDGYRVHTSQSKLSKRR